MTRFSRILSDPQKYLSPSHIINNVVFGRLFLLWRRLSPFIPSDRLFLKVYYRLAMGKRLNLNNPQTFTEKIQWLKLHNTDPLYSKMVDKHQVRSIVADKIGNKYLIPLVGVYSSFDEIDVSSLPNKFVIKTTHDSGNVLVCTEKANFDFAEAKRRMEKALKSNYFYKSREYPYKNAVPRIIIEDFIESDTPELGLIDYKFFCFNGEPRILLVVSSRTGICRNDFFDMNFNPIDVHLGFERSETPIKRPTNFEEMISVAKLLSKGLVHVRIDLYNIKDKIYFGEYTFHHNGGLSVFKNKTDDIKWGDYIQIG